VLGGSSFATSACEVFPLRFTDFFIHRAITTTLLISAIAGFGLLSYLSLPVSNLPEVEYPTIQVSAVLPGANPESMAGTVATPLESEFSRIPGIENMTSNSTVGETDITLQFALNRSVDAAAQDVQAAISRAAGNLPVGMPQPPSYSKVNPADDPIIWLEMHSETMSFEDFSRYATQIVSKQISMVNGVSQVEVYGPERPAIRVQVDPARLASYSLDLEQIRIALTNNSASLPTGTLYGNVKDYSLQANSQLTTADQFSDLIVAYRSALPLRLSQIAHVLSSSSNDKRTFWINGRRSVILAVRKQPGANTIEVADRVKAAVQTLRDVLPPGVEFGKVADNADIVRGSIAEVNHTLVLTIVLVVLVIFAFLGTLSSTLIASATIPVSILGSFIAMHLLDYTVDMFSMMAITLSVGFVVDDAIVMLENIVRHREMGKSRLDAAVTGAAEVGFTILSMTLSLVAVFFPILFLNGVLGRLLREFAVTISVSILLSGFSALTLTPMLCSRFLSERVHGTNWFLRRTEGIHAALERGYQRSLDFVLRHPRATVVGSIAMTATTVVLFATVPKSFMPAVDTGSFSGSMEASQDNSFAQMISYGEQVNKALAAIPWMESNLSGVFSQNGGWLWVNLRQDRRRPNVKVIIADLQKQLDRIPGLKVYLRQPDFIDLGQTESRAQYSAALQSPDADQLYRWAPRLKSKLDSLSELANVSTDLQMSAPRVNVDIRRDLAMSLNVDPEKIANTLCATKRTIWGGLAARP
jgi:HAE1 family hydrophobic/amphiphilic exporter-1